MRNTKFLASIGLLIATAIWGSTFFIIKDSIQVVNPITLLVFRFGIAAIAFTFIVIFQKQQLFKNFYHGILLGILMWISYVAQTVGLLYTSASNSGFITGTFILFIPLFGYIFFRTLPHRNQVFALITAFVGLWLLTGGIQHINFGDILTLGTAISVAIYILIADKLLKNKGNPSLLNFQQFLVVFILSLLTVLLFHLSWSFGNIQAVLSITYLAIFATVIAFAIQLFAQKKLNPLTSSVLLSMEPVFAALFSWTIGGEKIIPLHALGGFLIFLAVIIAELPRKK